MLSGRRHRIAGVAIASVAAVVLLASMWQTVVRAAIVGAVGATLGLHLSFGHLEVHRDWLSATNVHVESAAGEAIADVGSVRLRYSMADALWGARRFGLVGFDVENAHATIIRHRDGTLNVPLRSFGGSAAPSTTPYVVRGRVRGASLDVYDLAQGSGPEHHFAVKNFDADADVASNARSSYRVHLNYVEDGQTFPIDGRGDVDVAAGIGLQRWWAPQVPLARVADFALPSAALRISSGRLRNIDARIVGLRASDATFAQHVSATVTLDGGGIVIRGLSKPLRNVSGRFAVYGDGLLLQDVNATLAGMPIRLGGGVFGSTSPRARLTVTGRGDLRNVRSILAQTARLPLNGPIRIDVAIEGPLAKPMALVELRSPRAAYGAYAFDGANGLVALDDREVDVVGFHTDYARIRLTALGKIALDAPSNAVEMLAGFDAPADSLPYANMLAPGVPLHAAVLATGDRPALLETRGLVYGARRDRGLEAPFDLRSNGTGILGPLRVAGPKQSLYAIAALDRPRSTYDAYADASNLRVEAVRTPSLPGLGLAAPPRFAAGIDSIVAGHAHGEQFQLAGFANLRDIRTPAGNVARANLQFGRTASAPLSVDIDARGVGALGAVATAILSYDHDTLRVKDAAAAAGGTFADASGEVNGMRSGAPRFDLRAHVHSADVTSLAEMVQPRAAGLLEGSLEARLRVSGSGAAPQIDGTARLPEGAVNGLAFHDLDASIHGTPARMALDNGSVGIGSTDVAFNGSIGSSSQRVNVTAGNADLADFNDFFDAGDVLGGEGHVRAALAIAGGSVVATSGDAELRNVALRGFDIGTARGSWNGGGNRIDAAVAFAGPSGRMSAVGSVGFDESVDLTAHARDFDLARWLPMAGFVVPVTGLAQADIAIDGRYPDFDSRLDARVAHGSVGRVPVTSFSIAATTVHGRGRIDGTTLAIPNARLAGGGTFGLHSSDRLGLTFRATTPDVAALDHTLTGKTIDAAGSFDTALRIGGTLRHPALDDDFTLTAARYRKFDVARIAGHLRADERAVTLTSGEIDLQKGRILARGSAPIRLQPFGIDRDGPVSAAITADDVEASNVAALLPAKTTLGGRIDGQVRVSGRVAAPRLSGVMTLANGNFSGPAERMPITGATAALAFSGTSVRLQNAHANVGGGIIAAGGRATIPDLRDPARASVALDLQARGARLDLPQYIKGRFDGDVHLTRAPGLRPALSGTVAVDAARIPMTALYNPKSSSGAPVSLPDLGFDLRLIAGSDVRVVSPNVDVGTRGAAHLTGTLDAPQLAGTFTSTGGTVSFFREFAIENATVSFDPASGIVPDVDASATTFITNPDTNVALRVTGPATHLDVAFASDPSYDREQILGLLVNAQSLGAVHGVQTSGSSPVTASSAVSSLAGGQVNTIFTRNLLEPLSLAMGNSLGLTDLQITNDVHSGLGLNAVKAFGKDMSFVFADTFNEPRRESWSLLAHPSDRTQFEFTAYSSQGTLLGYQPFLIQRLDMGSAATIPLDTGTNGVDVKVGRKFP
ncbi:MAG: translocation/assembly module TamB domain-containing protein [Candidatus Tumulicola sp.]